jgi:hypothetical protein
LKQLNRASPLGRRQNVALRNLPLGQHRAYAGHFRLRLIEVTPTRLDFEIARPENKYVEVTYDLDSKRFDEVRRIAHIIFGVRG